MKPTRVNKRESRKWRARAADCRANAELAKVEDPARARDLQLAAAGCEKLAEFTKNRSKKWPA